MNLLYRLIVLFFTVHIVWFLFREKRFWAQVGAAMVLVMFVLRLLLIK